MLFGKVAVPAYQGAQLLEKLKDQEASSLSNPEIPYFLPLRPINSKFWGAVIPILNIECL